MRSVTRKRNGRVNERGYYSSRPSTDEFSKFTRDFAVRYSEQELCDITGLGPQAVKKLRAGASTPSGVTISAWCKNCPDFRMAYFQYVGGQLETDPGFAAALSKTIQEWMRSRDAAE